MDKKEELLPYYKKAKDTLNYNPDTGGLLKFQKIRNNFKEAGTLSSRGYKTVGITFEGKTKILLAHRIIWFITNGEIPETIDHINGIKDDNRILNLRNCTQQQNRLNQGDYSSNTSGYKGVVWNKSRNKWQAQIRFKEEHFYLGQFDCPKEASEAYEAKAKELHGEFYHV